MSEEVIYEDFVVQLLRWAHEHIGGFQSDISTGYYRVVLRVGWVDWNGDGVYGVYDDLYDFHWWYQTKTGSWAQKRASAPSDNNTGASDAWIDPEICNWWLIYEGVPYNYFYNSDAIYLGRYY